MTGLRIETDSVVGIRVRIVDEDGKPLPIVFQKATITIEAGELTTAVLEGVEVKSMSVLVETGCIEIVPKEE